MQYDDTSDYLLGKDDSVEKSGMQAMMSEYVDVPVLSPEEERSLFLQMRQAEAEGDTRKRKAIFDKLVHHNMRLVIKIANYHLKNSFVHAATFRDLVNEGAIGLITAIESFDVDKGNKLSTHATYWIRQTIMRGIARYGTENCSFPPNVWNDLRKVMAVYNKLREEDGTQSERDIVQATAQALGFSRAKTMNLIQAGFYPVSFEEKVQVSKSGGAETKTEDAAAFIADTRQISMEDKAESDAMAKDMIDLAKSVLSERSFDIFFHRWCVEPPEPYASIGLRYSLTGERVRQLDQKGRELLAIILEKGHLPEMRSENSEECEDTQTPKNEDDGWAGSPSAVAKTC